MGQVKIQEGWYYTAYGRSVKVGLGYLRIDVILATKNKESLDRVMKSSLALLALLSIDMSIASSQLLADQGAMRDPLLETERQSLLSQNIIIAQADNLDDGQPYRQTLDSLLERDDFAAASKFVDNLSENADVSPATLRSLKNWIRSVKTARLIEYAEKIRQAIASSDLEAMNDYSQRMQRLSSAVETSKPLSTIESEPSGSEDASLPLQQVQEPPKAEPREREEPSIAAVEPAPTVEAFPIQRVRKALDEDRLFPPKPDNAFDLATARLAEKPDDEDALDMLDDLINRQRSKVVASLDSGQPETALALRGALVNAFERLDDESATASSSRRSAALGWVEQIKPDIIAGLIAGTERAIGRWNLTVAPKNELSAEDYVDLLAEELRQGHGEVLRLANEIIDRYQDLIDDRLAQRDYQDASTFHARMQAVAERFGLPTDQIAEQGRYIATLPARQRQHDELLLQATQLRNKGQLIEPAGANALEVAARAVRLAANPAAADKVFNDVIFEQRIRIDRLIDSGRLEEAARQLQQVGAVVEKVGAGQIERANEYYAEADRVLEQAAREREQQRMEEAKENEPIAAAPVEASPPDDAPFTFVNPF